MVEACKDIGSARKDKDYKPFLINDRWYLVDLPGYGYAKVLLNSGRNG